MGGCRCSFRNCENSTATQPGMHFFHYPIRDAERLKEWLEIADKTEFLTLPTEKLKNKVICEKHFEERCFMNIKHERLIKTACPSFVDEMIEVPMDDISEYETLTIESVSNGKTIQHNNEPVVLNNRKRPIASNDLKNRSENFVVDLKLEALHNGDLTISFEEPALNAASQSAPSPAKVKRNSLYSTSDSGARKENRILNSSLNLLNSKFPEPIVLNNANLTTTEIHKKSPISRSQMKMEKKLSPIVHNPSPNILSNQAVSGFDIIDLNSATTGATFQTLDFSPIVDAINTTVKTLNVLDKNCFETKSTEQTNHIVDIKKALAGIKTKQDELAKDFKFTQECIKQISTNQNVQLNLLHAKQNQSGTGSSTKAESTTANNIKSKFNQNKIQLFNGIKKYLNPAMVALLRMELFGSSEREWKSDEKSISVELLNLGSSTYEYMRDEWRFRLPSKKDVETWSNDNLDNDENDSDVN